MQNNVLKCNAKETVLCRSIWNCNSLIKLFIIYGYCLAYSTPQNDLSVTYFGLLWNILICDTTSNTMGASMPLCFQKESMPLRFQKENMHLPKKKKFARNEWMRVGLDYGDGQALSLLQNCSWESLLETVPAAILVVGDYFFWYIWDYRCTLQLPWARPWTSVCHVF